MLYYEINMGVIDILKIDANYKVKKGDCMNAYFYFKRKVKEEKGLFFLKTFFYGSLFYLVMLVVWGYVIK